MQRSTVHQVFTATASRTPEAEFLFTESVTAAAYGIAAGAIRWREAAAEVERLRTAYAGAGYGHGHRVGLLLENRPAFLFHWFALNALGVSVVPINAEMRSAERISALIGTTLTPSALRASQCSRKAGRFSSSRPTRWPWP